MIEQLQNEGPSVKKSGKGLHQGLVVSRLQEDENTQKKLRERLRIQDFCRANGGWSWTIDERGCIVDISGQFTAVLGLREVEYMGQPIEQIGLLCPDEENVLPLVRARQSNSAFRDQLIALKDINDVEHRFYLSGVPILGAAGEVVGYRGTAVAAEHIVREFNQDSGLANQVQNAFLSNISHELRTPLNAILGFTETMRMEMFGSLSERYRHYCDDILQAGQHLLSLVDDMLDASELHNKAEVALSIMPITVTEIVKEAIALIGTEALEQGVSLDEHPIEPGFKVKGDRRRVKQILVNLLTNAVKYTGAGGDAGVEVSRGGGFVAITVWDTGPGIETSAQTRVFERFKRGGEDGYKGAQKGVGLGLHISRAFARQMGGDIVLDSELGVGSRFTLLLPEAC
jgi:signal transduction histidine kinase